AAPRGGPGFTGGGVCCGVDAGGRPPPRGPRQPPGRTPGPIAAPAVGRAPRPQGGFARMPADPSRWPRPAGLIAGLLPPAAAAAESAGDPPDAGPGLFPAEEAVMRTAGPRRRAEFAARRGWAGEARAGLGVPAAPILPGPAGEPRWPEGVTGSITHCAGYRACAVARTTDVAAIGIDAEPDAALPAGLIEKVATGPERAWIRRHADAVTGAGPTVAGPTGPGLTGAGPTAVCWDRLLFSAKEAA